MMKRVEKDNLMSTDEQELEEKKEERENVVVIRKDINIKLKGLQKKKQTLYFFIHKSHSFQYFFL